MRRGVSARPEVDHRVIFTRSLKSGGGFFSQPLALRHPLLAAHCSAPSAATNSQQRSLIIMIYGNAVGPQAHVRLVLPARRPFCATFQLAGWGCPRVVRDVESFLAGRGGGRIFSRQSAGCSAFAGAEQGEKTMMMMISIICISANCLMWPSAASARSR